MYLGWFDDNTKKPPADKVRDAIAAYRERFQEVPRVVLVNEAEMPIDIGGVVVRAESYIRRNNYWVGVDE